MRFPPFLALVALACISLPPLYAQAVPSSFQDLYTSLQGQLNTFDSQIMSGWSGTKTPVLFSGGVITANANDGEVLLTPNRLAGVQDELNRLAGAGVRAVTINVSFPLFYQPFFDFNGTSSQNAQFASFYQSVVAEAHKLNLFVIVESSVLYPGVYSSGSGFNLSGYYPTLSATAYAAGRAATAAAIATQLQPDYLSVGAEPDNEAAVTGQTFIDTPSGFASMVGQIVGAVRQTGSQVPVGAGVGTWLSTGSSFITSLAGSGIDYIDLHVYPVNLGYLGNLAAWSDQAKSLGLPVATSEAWLLKERDSEFSQYATASDPTIFSRDPFSFWSPLDQQFLQTMANYANWKGSLFISPFWTQYFWAYLDYTQVSTMTPTQIINAADQAASAAIVSGATTPAGTAYAGMIAAPQADTVVSVLSSARFITTALSPAAIVSVFGSNIASGPATATLPLPMTLNGASVTVTDKAGNVASAQLYSVSASQANLVIPSGLAPGWAKLTVHTASGAIEEANIPLRAVAPALFTANQTGSGPPAAIFTIAHADGTSAYNLVASCPTIATCVPVPLNLGGVGDQAYLSFYGSGIRGYSKGVSAIVGGMTIPAGYAGPQGSYPGMDQVNVQLPQSLAGAGPINVQLVVDGAYSNTVQIQIQ